MTSLDQLVCSRCGARSYPCGYCWRCGLFFTESARPVSFREWLGKGSRRP